MKKYTIICDYYATGEGRTMMVLYMIAYNIDQVKDKFVSVFNEYYWRGIDFYDGFIFDNSDKDNYINLEPVELLVTTGVRNLLEKDIMSQFYAQLHFNLS